MPPPPNRSLRHRLLTLPPPILPLVFLLSSSSLHSLTSLVCALPTFLALVRFLSSLFLSSRSFWPRLSASAPFSRPLHASAPCFALRPRQYTTLRSPFCVCLCDRYSRRLSLYAAGLLSPACTIPRYASNIAPSTHPKNVLRSSTNLRITTSADPLPTVGLSRPSPLSPRSPGANRVSKPLLSPSLFTSGPVFDLSQSTAKLNHLRSLRQKASRRRRDGVMSNERSCSRGPSSSSSPHRSSVRSTPSSTVESLAAGGDFQPQSEEALELDRELAELSRRRETAGDTESVTSAGLDQAAKDQLPAFLLQSRQGMTTTSAPSLTSSHN